MERKLVHRNAKPNLHFPSAHATFYSKQITLFLTLFCVMLSGCSSGGSHNSQKSLTLSQEADIARSQFLLKAPDMKNYFDTAAGYVIFPTVGKGGLGIGGAYGEGCVFENGKLVGYAELTQVTVGFQLGGQAFREVIFFQTDRALNNFKDEEFEFSANASAVAVTAGASTANDYERGVAVFTMAKGGLMFEASIGGQKFSYKAK